MMLEPLFVLGVLLLTNVSALGGACCAKVGRQSNERARPHTTRRRKLDIARLQAVRQIVLIQIQKARGVPTAHLLLGSDVAFGGKDVLGVRRKSGRVYSGCEESQGNSAG